MKARIYTVSFLIILLIIGCSRTNELANYNVKGSNILIKEHVAYGARTIQFEKKSSSKDDKNKDDNLTDVIEAIAEISTGILTSEHKQKLQNAVDTESMVQYISGSLAETFETYL